ncbi:hypothetical protein D9Q98_001615 [Chlorella vulgaris]|uniref:Uncharacterized protein n=1 Tax=Chlorella vulgaris TaxID=3077 RepID=A0A9D4TUN8_CHLVU|nr:hypothetical protein D9Q98_001615 [Chlorella vulgaris]
MPGPAARAGVPLVTGGSSTCLSAWHGSQQRQKIGALRVSASKGFGKATQQKKQVEDGAPVPGQREGDRVKAVKFKGKKSMRQGPQAQQARDSRGDGTVAQPGFNMLQEGDGEATDNLVDKIEFEQRLKALAAESEAKRREQQAAAARGGGILGSTRPDEDIYANVQPLTKTLLPRDDSGAAKEYEGSQFGPSQAALAAAAVLLGAVFLITSGGGDYTPSRRPQQAGLMQQQQMSEETRKDLEQQLATVQEQLDREREGEGQGGGLGALEAAAVLNARLGRFEEAEALLVRLREAKPGDAEVLRVLAETQASQRKWEPAVANYRLAWEAGGRGSAEVLQGLAAALLADGKEAAAVEAVQAAQAEGGSTIGGAELQLLAAKTYAQWRGHVPDAIAVYDKLIETRPEDFRAYLAKGLLLQDQGRAGDAQRYFIQARFYAKEQKNVVDQIIAARQQQ